MFCRSGPRLTALHGAQRATSWTRAPCFLPIAVVTLFTSSPVGQSAADWSGGLGEMVRPGLQHQGGGGGHRRGHLPVAGRLRGTVRRPEAPPGSALLRILRFARSPRRPRGLLLSRARVVMVLFKRNREMSHF